MGSALPGEIFLLAFPRALSWVLYFFLVYINDLTRDLKCSVKLFADNTSSFTVFENPNTAAKDMNHDLELISQWARDWNISFNPDPQKQATELTFSRKNRN